METNQNARLWIDESEHVSTVGYCLDLDKSGVLINTKTIWASRHRDKRRKRETTCRGLYNQSIYHDISRIRRWKESLGGQKRKWVVVVVYGVTRAVSYRAGV